MGNMMVLRGSGTWGGDGSSKRSGDHGLMQRGTYAIARALQLAPGDAGALDAYATVLAAARFPDAIADELRKSYPGPFDFPSSSSEVFARAKQAGGRGDTRAMPGPAPM